MKNPIENGSLPIARRELLKAATAGAALSLLPGVGFAAMSKALKGPSLAVGYWQKSGARTQTNSGTLVDALTVTSIAGNYALRVDAVSTSVPISFSAQYPGGAEHFFWQAWAVQGLLQRSAPITIRWAADKRAALPLVIHQGSGLATTQINARAGVYAVAIGPNGQALPSLSGLALANNASKLISRSSGAEVAFPYAVFSVLSGA